MRTLKTEEMELVAGGDAGGAPTRQRNEPRNNGLGNGDQDAPGGSGPNNGAENSAGGTTGNPPGSGNSPSSPTDQPD